MNYHLDFETKSRSDLKKVGAYRYACDPSTRVLMFAIARGDEEPVLWVNPEFDADLISNPRALTLLDEALADPEALLWAHNAEFERAVSRYRMKPDIGRDPPPTERWRCTAALARKAGLRASLANVAEDLNLGQKKWGEGYQLIRLFSIPQKTTGEFTDPLTEPAKFARFGDYCLQDVRSEREVHQRLKPFELKTAALETFLFDARMNDRGLPLNMAALRHADAMIDRVQARVTAEFQKLTGLNPTQRDKVKAYLEGLGLKLANMQSKTTDDVISEHDEEDDGEDMLFEPGENPTDIALKALALYKQVSYAAVKKVKTMLACACPDGQARGMFLYHGAGTGRWCLTGDHEVLTRQGWVRLDVWKGGQIACWNPEEVVSFQQSDPVSFAFKGLLYHQISQRIDQIATAEHRNPGWGTASKQFQVRTADQLNSGFAIPYTGTREKSAAFPADHVRMLVAVQADAHYCPDGSIKFHLKKDRKIVRVKQLLRRNDLVHSIKLNEDGSTTVSISSRHVPTYLHLFRDKTFGPWLLDVDAAVFFEELELWDGYRCGPKSIQYSTCNRTNADWVQALAHTSGLAVSIITREKRDPKWATSYCVNVWLTPSNRNCLPGRPSTVAYEGTVYCASTPTGFFLVRRNGTVWVTGNSGQKLQPQNFKKPTIKDADGVYAMLCAGCTEDDIDSLYGNPLEAIANCIRNFIHDPAGPMFDADYAAIEARIICWLAGQEDALERFRKGVDSYKHLASHVYGKPIDKINPAERELGKRGVLGCLFGVWWPKFQKSCWDQYRIKVSDELAERIVITTRDTYSLVVNFWKDCERKAREAVLTPNERMVAGKVVFETRTVSGLPYLLMHLPSKRVIAYPHPKICVLEKETEESLSYYGQLPGTAKWGRVKLYSSKFAENATQAVAADIMASGAVNAERKGFTIWGLIHDQALAQVKGKLDDFIAALTELPPWAAGLPIKAEGRTTEWYRK
jgi:hypothetical protein